MKTAENKGYRIQIIVALIGVAGVLGAAVISNLDKIFKEPVVRHTEPNVEPGIRPTEPNVEPVIMPPRPYAAPVEPRKPTPEAIEKRVIELISEQFGIDKSKITREVSFVYDLYADELDKVELIMEYEDEFDISIPDDDAEKFQTVGTVIDYIINATR